MRKKLEKNARKKALKYTWEEVAKKYLKVFKEVIENEKNLTNILTSNTVYESSDIKAKNSVFMITLIVLVLMIIFLIFRKGL